jgi:hypothetical protein
MGAAANAAASWAPWFERASWPVPMTGLIAPSCSGST